jgi:hypothetical protein
MGTKKKKTKKREKKKKKKKLLGEGGEMKTRKEPNHQPIRKIIK